MVSPCSVDLREPVVRFLAWLASGSLTPKPLGGRRFSKLDPHSAFLIAALEKQPDITMPELAAALAARCSLSVAAIGWHPWQATGTATCERWVAKL